MAWLLGYTKDSGKMKYQAPDNQAYKLDDRMETVGLGKQEKKCHIRARNYEKK